jgi:pyruvate/2-oxoglutarate dehydrogenase complex dihydrolipoamide dehydrogenase (E3) component
MMDVVVIGGGPAGMTAALRAGDLGAKALLVTRDEFGGMAANERRTGSREDARTRRSLAS